MPTSFEPVTDNGLGFSQAQGKPSTLETIKGAFTREHYFRGLSNLAAECLGLIDSLAQVRSSNKAHRDLWMHKSQLSAAYQNHLNRSPRTRNKYPSAVNLLIRYESRSNKIQIKNVLFIKLFCFNFCKAVEQSKVRKTFHISIIWQFHWTIPETKVVFSAVRPCPEKGGVEKGTSLYKNCLSQEMWITWCVSSHQATETVITSEPTIESKSWKVRLERPGMCCSSLSSWTRFLFMALWVITVHIWILLPPHLLLETLKRPWIKGSLRYFILWHSHSIRFRIRENGINEHKRYFIN